MATKPSIGNRRRSPQRPGHPPCRFAVWAPLLAALWIPAAAVAQEPPLPPAERAKLDTFEGVMLDKADKVFAAGDYRRAVSEYDSLILQFPKSKAIPYAIVRKGRSLQNLEKRFEAIKVYEEVLDFFPNEVSYATLALFRIGECHQQNGDVGKALKAWSALADDADYVKEPLGAVALTHLAENLMQQGKPDEGIARYEQIAVDFRGRNPGAAMQAIGRVVPFHVVSQPSLEKTRAFYEKTRTFESSPQPPGESQNTDALFWQRVRETIKQHGRFNDAQKEKRNAVYRYWAEKMEPLFPADDSFQIDVANFHRIHDQNEAAWIRRLDKQFADHQKEGNVARILGWIRLLAARPDKVEEYYRKLDFSKMNTDTIISLVFTLFDIPSERQRATNAFDKVPLADMTDDAKAALLGGLTQRGLHDLVLRTCQSFHDQLRGKLLLLRYLHGRCKAGPAAAQKDFTMALGLSKELAANPATAKEACLIRGNLLQWSGQYQEAIQAYQLADSPPATLYLIADCLKSLGKIEPAVSQLREIENFFKDQSSIAALQVAYLYRDAGNRKKYVGELRGVLKKYPQSGQSSEAHQRLEEMGLPIGGGVNAEE
jgi:tetratricopeptide (TPR) repeat protein